METVFDTVTADSHRACERQAPPPAPPLSVSASVTKPKTRTKPKQELGSAGGEKPFKSI